MHPKISDRAKFDLDLRNGEAWEGFFQGIVKSGKIECKRDRLAHKTGNVFIEYRCRGKDSGLSMTEAEWWAIGIENKHGDIETAILASVPWLKAKCRQVAKKYPRRNINGGDDNAAQGVLLKLDDFRE